MTGILNGAPIPNWAKLLALGAVMGTVWAGQQSSVGQLQEGQRETTRAVQELRADMRDRMVSRDQWEAVVQRLAYDDKRLDALEGER